MSELKIIYLQPICIECGYREDERQWCQDDIWSGDSCDECGAILPDSPEYKLARNPQPIRGQ